MCVCVCVCIVIVLKMFIPSIQFISENRGRMEIMKACVYDTEHALVWDIVFVHLTDRIIRISQRWEWLISARRSQ